MRDEETASPSTTSGSTLIAVEAALRADLGARARACRRGLRPNALSGVMVMPRSSIAGASAARNASGSSAAQRIVEADLDRVVDPRLATGASEGDVRRQQALDDGAGPDDLVGMRAEDQRHARGVALPRGRARSRRRGGGGRDARRRRRPG